MRLKKSGSKFVVKHHTGKFLAVGLNTTREVDLFNASTFRSKEVAYTCAKLAYKDGEFTIERV